MSTIPSRHSAKRSTNVYLTASLVDKARSMNMNLSATLDELLAKAIESRQNEQAKEKEDMQAMNRFMTKAGLLSDDEFFGGL
ncbi:type II toxin-antitoxin system CcdA family antitoxin [Jinshanibacter sp. LJY008]|uniref:Type II toxin-antitoxin system CcdA family antitoxin n=1 Tax=Limnobaculum eriocheiris TaxID=2897391 RepID=A0A9X1SML4_9GAMM|nr:type II toxin-antitoxin system CcdA family antitoxin [Limnobaculum eriocheiris]MCD1127399.1 type II toxin-antitoxin system CcdA family antitoxin [Limnobaculum eriocheiris]